MMSQTFSRNSSCIQYRATAASDQGTMANWLALILIFLLGAVGAHAAPDDVEALPVQNQNNQQFFMDDNNLEANVFQPHGSAKQARTGIENRLKLQIDELHRVCDLSNSQKEKLKLAATNDVRKFFGEFEALRKKFKEGKKDQQAWQNIWQEIHPLQTKLAAGLFGENSFFAKSTRSVLNEAQLVKYDDVVRERRRFRYRASIEVVMEIVENSVPLHPHQHDAIVNLLVEETQPPLAFGQHDQQYVTYSLAKLPESKLRTILEDRQWKLMQQQLNQGRGWEQWLVQQGLIAKEDADTRKVKARVRRLIKRPEAGEGPADAIQAENK